MSIDMKRQELITRLTLLGADASFFMEMDATNENLEKIVSSMEIAVKKYEKELTEEIERDIIINKLKTDFAKYGIEWRGYTI